MSIDKDVQQNSDLNTSDINTDDVSHQTEASVTDVSATEISEDEMSQAPILRAGDLLREKRESLGLTQKQLADKLRLRVAIIEGIDENNYEFDQGATFTRGYLRSYAKAVSLDIDEVLAAFDGVEEPKETELKMQSFSSKVKQERSDSRVTRLTWVIIIIVICISSVWWYQSQQDTLTETSKKTLLLQEKAQPASPNRALVASEQDNTELSQIESVQADNKETSEGTIEQGSNAGTTAEANQDSAVDNSAQSNGLGTGEQEAAMVEESAKEVEPSNVEEIVIIEEDTTPLEAQAGAVVMSFSDDCWIQVNDATGKVLATGVKKAGTQFSLSGQAPYSFIIGRPEVVEMTFASEKVDLSGYTAGKVARFTLPKQ